MEKEVKLKNSNKESSAKITVWLLLSYFIIYSVIGYILETAFGILTKGVLESRKGFLYGPFCPIYGLGAVVMILSLKKFTKNNYLLFTAGAIVGSIVEYLVSFFGEVIFNTKWWDYSDQILNINGRVCLSFALMWGLLSIYLMQHFNPKVDKFITNIKGRAKNNVLKVSICILSVFLLLDMIITCVGVKVFYSRIIYTYELNVENKEMFVQSYEKLKSNSKKYELYNKIFSDKFMLKTFPNLKIATKDENIVYVRDLLSDISPYYLKLFTPKYNK